MKPFVVLALLAASTYVYFHGSASPPADFWRPISSHPTAAAPTVIIAPAPSSYERWKTGPNAQTDLKTGPNAQTDFEPFAPSEQATWNQPSWTVVSGIRIIRR
jgi:hypothetical protein